MWAALPFNNNNALRCLLSLDGFQNSLENIQHSLSYHHCFLLYYTLFTFFSTVFFLIILFILFVFTKIPLFRLIFKLLSIFQILWWYFSHLFYNSKLFFLILMTTSCINHSPINIFMGFFTYYPSCLLTSVEKSHVENKFLLLFEVSY